MRVIPTTLLATATRLVPKDPVIDRPVPFQQITIGIPVAATGICYLGDAAVTSTRGIPLQPGTFFTISCFWAPTEDLKSYYVLGPAGTIVTVMVID